MSLKLGWDYVQNGGVLPISVIKVEADYTHLSPKTLQQVISNDLPANFWTIDVRALKAHIQAIAWVQSVDIEKIWPETLKIRVNEKKVLARWGSPDTTNAAPVALVSDKNEIFYPNADFLPLELTDTTISDATLPILYAPDEQVKTILMQYHMMGELLKKYDLSIKMLLLSDSHAWMLRLNNDTLLLLGREQPMQRLMRFLQVYPTIFVKTDESHHEYLRKARRVDLRYPHGMAISWATEMPEIKNNH